MLNSKSEDWHKIHVVRCGLDQPFLVGPAPAPPRGNRLVCVGRLSPEKGQVLLLEATARLKERGVDVEVVLVGDGPSRGEIERRAAELGVQDRIRLVGWQSSADVRRWISESRALVVPSFAEGIPVVAMEAMALGRPVIATCVGGLPELVQPGENGHLVPAGSVEDLAAAMTELLRAPDAQIQRMGEKGRQRVLECHDLSVEVRKLAALFERGIR